MDGIKEFSKNYIVEMKKMLDEINLEKVQRVAEIIFEAYQNDKQIFIMGNGGSASTASHFACDLGKGTLERFYDDEEKRFRAISLTDNVATLMAFSNDLSFDDVFVQQLKNLVNPGDIVIGMSGSGNSPNIIKAIEYAKKCGAVTIGFLGFRTGGKLAGLVDYEITVQDNHYGRIEDVHLVLQHLITNYLAKIKNRHRVSLASLATNPNNMKEKILITGITGFVGSHLADLLLEKENIEVYGLKRWNLSRLRNVKHLLDNKRVSFLDCDLTDPVAIKQIIRKIKPDKIFHLAAESFVSPSWRHPSHYMDVNFKGTLNLLEAVREEGINPRFLIPGSGEEYGEIYERELPITENTVLRPVNPYAVSKIAQDFIGYVYYRSYGLNVIRTRAFNHEGPRRDYVFGIPWYAYQIARIEAGKQEPIIRVGHIDDKRNFTHIRDLVEAYWLAIQHCQPGELYLIGSEEPDHIYTFREVLNKLIEMAGLSGRGIQIVQDPQFVRPTSVPRLIGDTRKFRELTGWRPKIPFEKILEDTLAYWRDFVRRDLY